MRRQIPNFNNSIYLQRSLNLENQIVNELNEEEDFPFIAPNKFFLFIKFISFFIFLIEVIHHFENKNILMIDLR
jgi:hypothetical protein